VRVTYDPSVICLMLTEGPNVVARDVESVMEDISSRANQVGSILEGILHDPHCESHINWDKK
jgi:hypothetical protein